MPNNIAVSITADVIDLQAKRAILSAELKAATKDLNTFAKEAAASGSTEALREGMLASADAAQKARNSIALVNTELKEMAATAAPAVEHAAGGFGGLSVSVREAGMQIRESIGVMGEMREAMMAFGEALIAAFAVERIAEWAKEMGEAAEKTVHLAQTFGMTVAEIQQLDAVAKMTGISIDVITKGMGILDKNLVVGAQHGSAAASAFKAMGIAANDGKTQMQLLEAVAEKFKNMDDGPKKVALAMTLFGKSGKELIPILNMGADGLAEINRKTQEYGAVNEAAASKGMALADSLDESTIAMQGVSNMMTDAFAPVLKSATDGINEMIRSMVESYDTGGTMKVVLDQVAQSIRDLGSVTKDLTGTITDLADIFREATTSILGDAEKTFKDGLPPMFNPLFISLHQVAVAIHALRDAVEIAVAYIVSFFEQLVEQVKLAFKIIYDVMTFDWGSISADWSSGIQKIVDINASATNRIRSLWQDLKGALGFDTGSEKAAPYLLTEANGFRPKSESGSTDFSPGGGGKHKKGKSDKASVLDQWRTELADMLALEENWDADEAALTLKFWESKLALTKKGSKEEVEIRRDIARAKLALHKEEQQDEISSIKSLQALKLEAAQADVQFAKMALQEKLSDIDEEVAAGRMSAARALEAKAALNRQLYQLDENLALEEYGIKLKALQDEQRLYKEGTERYKEYARQIELITKQYNDQARAMSAQTAQKEIADERAVLAERNKNMRSLASGWANALTQMATLQAGFMTTVKNLWQGLVGVVANVLQQIIEKWIVAQLIKLGLIKTEHAATLGSEASLAGAGGVASMAAAPFPLNLTAPAFGASMAAAAMAFGSLGFAAMDGYDVPGLAGPGIDGRGGQLGIVHPREMVLPADIADPLRNGGGGGGHNFFIQTMDARSFEQFLKKKGGAVASALSAHYRNGGRG